MPRAVTLTGAACRVYINGRVYKEAQSISYSFDHGVTEIFGIDSSFPQELADGRKTVSGTINGIKIRYSGDLQGYNAISLTKDILGNPYISIMIQDKANGETLLFVPNARIVSEQIGIATKRTVTYSFSFKGLIGLRPLDLANNTL
jgi:hypothetical protein